MRYAVYGKPTTGRVIWTDGSQALLWFTSAHGEYVGERWVLKQDYLGDPNLFEFSTRKPPLTHTESTIV